MPTVVDWHAEVARRFQDYPEGSFRYEAEHRAVRQACRQLAVTLIEALPETPEKLEVIKDLDRAMLRAQAAIDRQDAI